MNYTLDRWDCLLIDNFKSFDRCNIPAIKGIWSKRCGIHHEFVNLVNINEHLIEVAVKIELLNQENLADFMYKLQPNCNWRYTCDSMPWILKDETDFNKIMLSRLASLFACAKISNLPGYSKNHNKSCENS